MTRQLFVLTLILSIFVLYGANSLAQSNKPIPSGVIEGRVIDANSKSLLAGVSVVLQNSAFGIVSDSLGNYVISNISPGTYDLTFSHIGYEAKSITNIIVNANDTTVINAELKQSALRGKDISVTTEYFILREQQPTSVINFSGAEISSMVGSAGDVSRAITVLPSISRFDDRVNNLMVRGGNHLENGYIIDNLELPSIDHYTAQTGGGGVFGFLNMDLIRDLNFYSGGFPAAYGDKLSSYIDITLREGNREHFAGNLAMSLAGFGGEVEGPIAGGKGSWILSARRGFLDLLMKVFDVDIVPDNYDFQSKLVYDITPRNKVSLLNIMGSSEVELSKTSEWTSGGYGSSKTTKAVLGVTWRHIWSESGFSDLSVAYVNSGDDYIARYIATGNIRQQSNMKQYSFDIKNDNYRKFGERFQLDFGMITKTITYHYDNFVTYRYYYPFYYVPELYVKFDQTHRKSAGYTSLIVRPFDNFSFVAGLRADYFSFNHNYHIAPRLSFSYRLTEKTSFNGASGMYYQTVPMPILAQHEEYVDLEDIKAYHYILGINHLLDDDVKLSLEFFDKEYFDVPADTIGLNMFPLDELMTLYGDTRNFNNLSSSGRAYSQGLEFTLQKKLSNRFFGLIGMTYSMSKYLGHDGKWRSRVTDNRKVVSAEAGYRLGHGFEVNIRWDFAGGTPYTPIDSAASMQYGSEVFDSSQVNALRYPDYHSLFIRFDKRFNIGDSYLDIYISIWNVYNRQNIAIIYWDDADNRIRTSHQLGFLPVLGFKCEF